MKKWFILGSLIGLLALLLAASGSTDEGEVRGVVINADRAMEEAFNGKGDVAAVEQYFATPEEGAHLGGLANTRDAMWKVFGDHPRGSALIQFLNFRITDVQVHSSADLAKVTYQIDVRMVHNGNVSTRTVTQDLAAAENQGARLAHQRRRRRAVEQCDRVIAVEGRCIRELSAFWSLARVRSCARDWSHS